MTPTEETGDTHDEQLDSGRPTFDVALGRRLRKIRQEEERTAQQVSRASRLAGLGWGPTTVSRVESGERSVSALELMLLTRLYERSVADLLPVDACRLADEVVADEGVLSQALTTYPAGLRMPQVGGDVDRAPEAAVGSGVEDAAPLWPVTDLGLLREALGAPVEEAESKAARRLGTEVSAEDVRVAARVLWGRTLVDERDARLGDDAGDGARARQARRGHITRTLTDELRPVVEGFVAHRAERDGDA